MTGTRWPVILLFSWVFLLPTTVSATDSIHLSIEDYPVSLECLAKTVMALDHQIYFPNGVQLYLEGVDDKTIYFSVSDDGPDKRIQRWINIRPKVGDNIQLYDIVLIRNVKNTRIQIVTNAQGKYKRAAIIQIQEKKGRWIQRENEGKAQLMKEISFWLNWAEEQGC